MAVSLSYAIVTPVTVSVVTESVLAQAIIPQLVPFTQALPGTLPATVTPAATRFRITAEGVFTVGGTAGTITASLRIGGGQGAINGTLLGTCVTGTLTLSTSGAFVFTATVTLTSNGNWSGAVSMVGSGTGTSVLGAGAGTAALTSAVPQYMTLTTTLSSATSSLTMNSGSVEQVA